MASLDGRPTVLAGSGSNISDPLLQIERYNEISERWQIVTDLELSEEVWATAGVGNINFKDVATCAFG